MYIDDMLFVGHTEAINEGIESLKQEFKMKQAENLEDYLGIRIVRNQDRTQAWLGQPSIIKSLEVKFLKYVEKLRSTLTPGTPGFVGLRGLDESSLIGEDDQGVYRSGVGILLYLTKHSRPDICNPVRELSKNMDGATRSQEKELLRVIKFVLDTKDFGLKLKPIKEEGSWKLKALSDSDFASDGDTRISVYGFVIYFCGVPISWKSKGMKSVVLSTTEAEYVAVSEVVRELQFIINLLKSIGIEVELPIKVQVDNVGAIWLANNSTTSERTKHVDIRAHYVREFIVDGVVTIVFVKSKDNDSDIFTKNLMNELYKIHSPKLIWTIQQMNEEFKEKYGVQD